MSGQRWMDRLEQAFGRMAARAHARPLRALAVAAVLSVVGGAFASRLSLSADLTALLPHSMESVRNAEQLAERFGGIGYVVVVGHGSDVAGLERFADDVAPVLEQVDGIRWVDARRDADFFTEHGLYYLSVDDLREVERRLDERLRWERRKRNPMFVQLEEEAPPSLDFSDMQQKYAGSSSTRLSGDGRAHYLDPKAGMVVVLAKPKANSIDLGFSKALLERVDRALAGVDRSKYGPDFRIELTGAYQKKIDQQRQITSDIAVASAVALVLLLLYLALHFRSLVAVGLNLVPVGVGLAWTYGVVGAAYGQVNLLTGFLGAILGGLGIEHGIHLLGRWKALRAGGASSEDATRDAFAHTGASALVSAFVAALTFGSLALSEFRAFREFGVIAAVGMLVVVGAYLLVLPALLGLVSRLGWNPTTREGGTSRSALARWLPRFRLPIALGVGAVFALLIVDMPRVRFDYDLASLEDWRLPSFALDRKVNEILGYSQTPAVVLTDSARDEAAVVEELARRRAANGGTSTIDFIASLGDLVPARQEEKRAVLSSIGALLDKVSPDALDAELRDGFALLRKATRAAPFTREDLPESVTRQFTGITQQGQGDEGGFVLVFPRVRLSDGSAVRAFAAEASDLPLADGRSLSPAGEAMILSDIITLVTGEAPLVLVAAILSVLLAMWLTLGSLREAVLCVMPTLVSILALVGLMPLVGERFNFLNIMVVPVLVGVTVDASVHLVSRLRTGEEFGSVFVETGRAISGGLITSAVGFGALLLADHPGLNSVGRLANLGFALNLVIMLLGFPALFLVLQRRRHEEDDHDTASAAEPEEGEVLG